MAGWGVQVEPVNEQLFATACSDNSVAVWDRRKLSKGGKPLSTVSHSLTCQSAFFAPDGMHLLLVCCLSPLASLLLTDL